MSRPSARRSGFTLVELLVVILVIGILATITFGLFKAANIGRNKSKSKGEIQAISMAAQSFRKAYGEFPCCATGTDDRFRRDLLDQLLGRRLLRFATPGAPPEDFEGAKVLLLSHDASEAATLSHALQADGMALEQFSDEKLVWQKLQDPAAHYDLVLNSLPMPGGDPLRLASRLRAEAETRDLPLMLIANAEQRELVLRAFELGASDHVLRPINEEELRARVRNQVRRRRYQLRLRAEFDRSLELAVTDGLTGLRNRRYVVRHLESLLRDGAACGVLMIDVDRFKPLNDYYGHAAGDAALREVAARLREHVRASDIVARYGGEEFLVVMSGAGIEETGVIAERLRSAIGNSPIDLGQAKLPVTVSIGSALSAVSADAAALIAAADAAMYRAKSLGRNRVEAATNQDWRSA